MRKSAALAVVVSLVLAAATWADFPALSIGDSVDVQYTHVGPKKAVNIQSTWTSYTSVYAGVYNLKVDGVAMQSFCIDLQDLASTNTHTYEVKALKDAPDEGFGPMGQAKAAALSELLARNWDDIGSSDVAAAALQLAVWEVVSDFGTAGYGLDEGTFKTTSYVDEVNALLGSISGTIPATDYFFAALSSGCHQDFVVRAVPVPGAALLGFLGLGTAGMKLRRRMG